MSVFPQSARLLIVEDDRDTRDILETILSEEGYTVSQAASPQEAMALLDEHVFHFILTDLFADTADGSLESVEPLRAHAHPTPIGVITGWKVSPEEVQRAGFVCLIRKPFELDEALTAVAASLHFPLSPEQQRQAEVIERFYDAINARSWEDALALCTAQLAYYPPPHSLYAPTRKLAGKGAYQAYAEDVFQRLSLTRFEDVLIYGRPKGLAARYTYGVMLPDGAAQQRAGTSIFHFEGDHIARIGVKVRQGRARTLMNRLHETTLGAPRDQTRR